MPENITPEQVRTMLETLSELYGYRDLLAIDKQTRMEEIFPVEVKHAIDDLNAEYHDKEQFILEKIAALEAEVKAAALELGESIKANDLQAVYSKPRPVWDTAKLEGMMALIPQIGTARSESKPYITIRKR